MGKDSRVVLGNFDLFEEKRFARLMERFANTCLCRKQ
jgi:hypothetical protein